MNRFAAILLFFFLYLSSSAQDTLVHANDSIFVQKNSVQLLPEVKQKRVEKVTLANVIGYGGVMTGLYAAWYRDYPQAPFHFFNDNNEWNQMDKAGHAYGAYLASRASTEMWTYAGLPRTKSVWIGAVSALAYQTAIETLDGFCADWGWSWGDFTANVFGSGLYVSQELGWKEQRMQVKFSFHRKTYSSPDLTERARNLFGKTTLERMLKDYNGQTYWVSTNIRSFFPKSSFPAWLNVAVGYGAEGLFDADDNVWKINGRTLDYRNIRRTKQFYFAPDIDLTKIKTKSKFLRISFFVLNSFKFPAPSLELNGGKLKWNWISF